MAEQVGIARRALAAAERSALLSRQRRETAVSRILEDLQAEEDLVRARREYVAVVADLNAAQYGLKFAIGE